MEPPTTIDDMHRIVREGVEESRRLELKRRLPESGKNHDLAKLIAAMANTEGGMILYGVDEDDEGRADELNPIDLEDAAERVNLVAQSSIDGRVELEDTHSIVEEDGKGYLVVVVPESDRAPHFVRYVAWGRTTKGNTRLGRRQIGELFAESEGFAEEFGLTVPQPGRVVVKADHESRFRSTRQDTEDLHFLVFENDGESDVEDVLYEMELREELEGRRELPKILSDPFPLPVMPAGHQARVRIQPFVGSAIAFNVRTRWTSADGQQEEMTWPIDIH